MLSECWGPSRSRLVQCLWEMGGLWDRLLGEAEGPCFKGLIVTLDKKWVGVLAEKWLPGGFCLLNRRSLQRCSLLCCCLPFNFVNVRRSEGVLTDLSGAGVSVGGEFPEDGSWKR